MRIVKCYRTEIFYGNNNYTKLELVTNRSSRPEVFCKKGFLEISQNSQENTCARVSFFNFIKKLTLVQVFSCEFCEISKSTFFYKTHPVAASVLIFELGLLTYFE